MLISAALLQDLAPVALYSHWDQGPNQARLPPGQSSWQHALPDTVQEDLSGLNGFRSPSMCKEVFQFGAQETTAVQATQHVQRFLTGGSSMRGSGSIALPPIPIPKVCPCTHQVNLCSTLRCECIFAWVARRHRESRRTGQHGQCHGPETLLHPSALQQKQSTLSLGSLCSLCASACRACHSFVCSLVWLLGFYHASTLRDVPAAARQVCVNVKHEV